MAYEQSLSNFLIPWVNVKKMRRNSKGLGLHLLFESGQGIELGKK